MKKNKKNRICKSRFLAFVLSVLMLIFALLGGLCISIGSGTLGKASIEDMITGSGLSSAITDVMADIIIDEMGKSNSNSENNASGSRASDGASAQSMRSGGASVQSMRSSGISVQPMSSSVISVQPVNRNVSVLSAVDDVTASPAAESQSEMDMFKVILESEQGKQLMDSVLNQVVGAVFDENKEFSTTDIEEQLMGLVDKEIEKVIDGYMDEVEANPDMKAADSKVISDLAKSLGITVPEEVYTALDEYDGDRNAFKESAKNAIDENFLNDFSDDIHEQLVEVEKEVNNKINEVHESGTLDLSIFDKFKQIISYVKIAGIVFIVLTVLMWLLQLLLYKKGIYGAFRNGAIVLFIAAVPLLVLGLMTNLTDIILGLDMVQELIAPLTEQGLKVDALLSSVLLSILGPFRTVGIIYAVVTVVFIILTIVLKIRHKAQMAAKQEEEENDTPVMAAEPVVAVTAEPAAAATPVVAATESAMAADAAATATEEVVSKEDEVVEDIPGIKTVRMNVSADVATPEIIIATKDE